MYVFPFCLHFQSPGVSKARLFSLLYIWLAENEAFFTVMKNLCI